MVNPLAGYARLATDSHEGWLSRTSDQGQTMKSDETAGRCQPGRHGHWRIARGLAAGLSFGVVLVACGGSSSSASSTSSGSLTSTSTSHALSGVTVTGPFPVGSHTFNNTLYGTSFNLSKVGYEKSQFFVSGTAHSYTPAQPLTSDGKWAVTTGVSAPYKTRIAVYRPINPKKFNGTVVVEWLNVSGGTDDSPDWTLSHNELIRDGFAWVGISAQQVGVNSAKTTESAEYSPLSHPGDSFSYDIFSQAGQAVRRDSSRILGGLRLHTLIAAGESQSAGRLMTYIDAIQPIRTSTKVFWSTANSVLALHFPKRRRPTTRHRTRPRSAATSVFRSSSSRPRPTSTTAI